MIANYESMSAIFRQRMTHGLQLLASYTWAHTLDVTTDSNGGGTPMNPYWWKADYGNSNWDIRHRFVATFVYDVPFFAVANPLLKGVFASGRPTASSRIQTGLAVQRLHRHRYREYRLQRHLPAEPGSHGDRRTAGAVTWWAASTPPPSRSRICIPSHPTNFAYGNAGRNLLRGPGAEAVNFSVFKNFPIKETAAVPVPVRDVRSVQSHELRQSVLDHQHVVVRKYHQRQRHAEYPARREAVVLVWNERWTRRSEGLCRRL